MKTGKVTTKILLLIFFVAMAGGLSLVHVSNFHSRNIVYQEDRILTQNHNRLSVIIETEIFACEFVPEYPASCIMFAW